MKEQLKKLMEAEGLSPAKFADEIGVQRSSISHIISGRNKPSYDFILKILNRFSGLNTEWLLTGRGSMIKSSDNDGEGRKSVETLFFKEEGLNHKTEAENDNQKPITQIKKEDSKNTQETINTNEKDQKKIIGFTDVNTIDYILVFYKDGTFKQYNSRE